MKTGGLSLWNHFSGQRLKSDPPKLFLYGFLLPEGVGQPFSILKLIHLNLDKTLDGRPQRTVPFGRPRPNDINREMQKLADF
jgi:hypothetical protein